MKGGERMAAKKGGLGKGLDALFTENFTDSRESVELNLSDIEPNRAQPRKEFDPKALEDLSESIAQHGVLQPLLVRPMATGGYQLVAGERRWRAARMAGLTRVPVVVRQMTDAQTMELALIENLQREDLNPVEEAQGYQVLMEQFGLTQEEVAQRVGKSRPAVANALRLLALNDPMLEQVRSGAITAGHGRSLLAFPEGEARERALQAAKEGATVRQLEQMAQRQAHPSSPPKQRTKKDSFYDEVALSLTAALGRRVSVRPGKGKGLLQIEYYDKEDLAAIANRLGAQE